uniref:Uncharacterized protein LOC114340564 n=1 Tax=Diabrotica virgifera virgifera TaxID=50390 RepID=A0A6P7GMB9_DIAVI
MSLYPDLSKAFKKENTKMSISLEIAEKMLVKFDGNKSKLKEFIRNCDIATESVSPDKADLLFRIIRTRLTDNAATLTDTRDFENWSDLKTLLLEIYSEKRTLSQWQLELNSCKQDFKESVVSYANRIETLYVKVINSLDSKLTGEPKKALLQVLKNQALHVFMIGLHKDLSLLVKSQKPDSLESAIALALAEEQEIKSQSEIAKYQFPSQKTCHICHKPGHLSFNCRQNKNSKQKEHFVRNFNRNHENTSSNPSYSYKFCNYCKKKGHVIDECRKRQYNNSRRNNNCPPDNSRAPNISQMHNQFQKLSLNNQSSPNPALARNAHTIQAESSHSVTE